MQAGLFNPVLASSSVQAGIESPDRHLLESQGVCFLGAKKEVSMLPQSRRGPLELDIRATSRSRSEPRVARALLAYASGATITARSIGRSGAVSTRRFSLPRWRRALSRPGRPARIPSEARAPGCRAGVPKAERPGLCRGVADVEVAGPAHSATSHRSELSELVETGSGDGMEDCFSKGDPPSQDIGLPGVTRAGFRQENGSSAVR